MSEHYPARWSRASNMNNTPMTLCTLSSFFCALESLYVAQHDLSGIFALQKTNDRQCLDRFDTKCN
eukprot:3962629-Amphidinium_carterae.1